MIAVTVHCDESACDAWAFAGSGFDPKDVDHGEFDPRSGWIDDTYELPEGWQRGQQVPPVNPAKPFFRCPEHAIAVST